MRCSLLFLPFLLAACGQASMSADVGSDAPSPCPASPPSVGEPCTAGARCHWLRCDDEGAVTALCTAGGTWDVSGRPCPIDCMGMTCAPGQICAIFQSGSQRFECVDDPCDGAALESCLCEVCPGGEPSRCSRNGFTVTCNTCFADICA